MVKIIRFLCIIGIIALLALFVGFTEFGQEKPAAKDVAETEISKDVPSTATNEPKASISFSIYELF
jgi:hypothetical protein